MFFIYNKDLYFLFFYYLIYGLNMSFHFMPCTYLLTILILIKLNDYLFGFKTLQREMAKMMAYQMAKGGIIGCNDPGPPPLTITTPEDNENNVSASFVIL